MFHGFLRYRLSNDAMLLSSSSQLLQVASSLLLFSRTLSRRTNQTATSTTTTSSSTTTRNRAPNTTRRRKEQPKRKAPPFSFTEFLQKEKEDPNYSYDQIMAPVEYIPNSPLAVRVYRPPPSTATKNIRTALVFWHGVGGSHSGTAGYARMARGLVVSNSDNDSNMVVYTPDIRGHGASKGTARGDADTVEQVLNDVSTVLDYVQQQEGMDIRIVLGGHALGGGLVMNYATWEQRSHRTSIAAYVLLAPHWGRAHTTTRTLVRPQHPFAIVTVLPFIVHAITGRMGHSPAVRFQYPAAVLQADPLLVRFNTVNMANALTATAPAQQLQSMTAATTTIATSSSTDHSTTATPVGVWVGENDEVLFAERLVAFCKGHSCDSTVVPGVNHLGILVNAHSFLGPWIRRLTTATTTHRKYNTLGAVK